MPSLPIASHACPAPRPTSIAAFQRHYLSPFPPRPALTSRPTFACPERRLGPSLPLVVWGLGVGMRPE